MKKLLFAVLLLMSACSRPEAGETKALNPITADPGTVFATRNVDYELPEAQPAPEGYLSSYETGDSSGGRSIQPGYYSSVEEVAQTLPMPVAEHGDEHGEAEEHGETEEHGEEVAEDHADETHSEEASSEEASSDEEAHSDEGIIESVSEAAAGAAAAVAGTVEEGVETTREAVAEGVEAAGEAVEDASEAVAEALEPAEAATEETAEAQASTQETEEAEPSETEAPEEAAPSEEAAEGEAVAFDWQALGEQTYNANCVSCHQATGAGIPGAFPPLAGHMPDLYNAEGGREYIINVVLYGLQGEINVDGNVYNGIMTPWSQLSDEEIAATLNHELNSWGNDALVTDFTPILPEEVAALRGQGLAPGDVLGLRPALGE